MRVRKTPRIPLGRSGEKVSAIIREIDPSGEADDADRQNHEAKEQPQDVRSVLPEERFEGNGFHAFQQKIQGRKKEKTAKDQQCDKQSINAYESKDFFDKLFSNVNIPAILAAFLGIAGVFSAYAGFFVFHTEVPSLWRPILKYHGI